MAAEGVVVVLVVIVFAGRVAVFINGFIVGQGCIFSIAIVVIVDGCATLVTEVLGIDATDARADEFGIAVAGGKMVD